MLLEAVFSQQKCHFTHAGSGEKLFPNGSGAYD